MTINNQIIDINILEKLLNKKLKQIRHDEFTFAPVSYGAVYLDFSDATYQITDFYKNITIFDTENEISVLKINHFKGEVKSYLENHKIISTKVNMPIKKIILVNVIKTITAITTDSNILLDTIGIIFTFNDEYQFAFEKDDFGEDIRIYRGYDLEEKFKAIPEEFQKSMNEGFYGKCTIEFKTIEKHLK